jgi:MFS transporter, FHS family, glucose/mannose:H+ symporter
LFFEFRAGIIEVGANDPLQTMPRHSPGENAATGAILAAFVVAGLVTTLLGPILPLLISRWSLSDEQAGLFFTVQFTSNMAGLASLSALLPWRGYKAALVPGYAAIALGLAGLNASTQVGGLVATAIFGYGLGLVLASSNLWVAEAAESRRVAALSILNFAWGIGAVACAPLVLLAQEHGAVKSFLYGVAAAALCGALVLITMNLGLPARKEEPAESVQPSSGTMAVVALGALFFLYVGVENSVAGWAAALAKRMAAGAGNLWPLAPMFFWTGLLAGRAFVPVNPLRRRERVLVTAGLITGLAGSALLLGTASFRGVAVGCVIAGLGFAAVYPVLVAWMAKQFGPRARRTGNILFALAALGGATMPWLVGFFSTREGDLRAGLLVPVAACLLMLACLFWIPKRVAG